ncbi:hypothetical protein D3C86_1334260 [compost metagenome]
MRYHGIEYRSGKRLLVPLQYNNIIFKILPDPGNGIIVKERGEGCNSLHRFLLVCTYRHVIGSTFFYGKAHTHHLYIIRIGTGGFGIETDFFMFLQFIDQGGNCFRSIGCMVLMWCIFCSFEGYKQFRGCCCSCITFAFCNSHLITKKIQLHLFIGGHFKGITQDTLTQGTEFQFSKYLHQIRFIHFAQAEILFMKMHSRYIGNDSSQFFRKNCTFFSRTYFLT